MVFKYVCAAVAVALMLAYLVPVIIKMKEIDLAAVLVVGLVMMLVDLVQSLREDD
jgi:hypothetical protein